MVTYLAKYVPWFTQKILPLQIRKTEILLKARKDGTLPPPKTNKATRHKWTQK